jgi:hypothetical protein
VTLDVVFRDPHLGGRCNSAAAIQQVWGLAAGDVMASLDVLAAGPDLSAYIQLPNVAHEGDRIVFKGSRADVVLDLAVLDGARPGVEVVQLDVRPKNRQT